MNNVNTSRRNLLGAVMAGGMVAVLAAPANAGDAGDLAAKKEVALGLSLAIMAGDWGKVDALISDDFVYIADGNVAIGKAQYVGFMQHVLSNAMTDMDMDFMRVVAEGDIVAVDYTNRMTHSGDFFGVPATGKRVLATGQFMRQVVDGKVVAEWQTTNAMGLMAQLTGS